MLPLLEAKRNRFGPDQIPCGEHDSLIEIAEKVGWGALEDLRIIGGSRNPWDRTVSAYHFYKNGRVARKVKTGKRRSFRAVTNVLAANLLPFKIWIYFYKPRSCRSYLVNRSRDLMASKVIRLESFQDDVGRLLDELNLSSVEMVKTNESERSDYRRYFNGRTRNLVARRFKDDIEAFGYEF